MIQHATREVVPTQLDACIDFYGEIGFTRVPQPAPLEGRAVWLEHRQSQIHLMPKADAVPRTVLVQRLPPATDGARDRFRWEPAW